MTRHAERYWQMARPRTGIRVTEGFQLISYRMQISEEPASYTSAPDNMYFKAAFTHLPSTKDWTS
jgi:hypothetical protein